MGRSQKTSPGPKQPKAKVKFSPNVTKEKVKNEPVTFLQVNKLKHFSAAT